MKTLLTLLSLSAAAAQAHSGHADTFSAAFMHPLLGWDHLLAAVLIGILAWQKKAVSLPAVFVASMLLAALASPLLSPVLAAPQAELMVQASLIVLALMVFISPHLNRATLLLTALMLGAAHGYLHGSEMGAGLPISALLGLAIATALLHGAGYLAVRGHLHLPKALALGAGLLGLVGLAT
jgi:urease accessory protein